MGFTGSSDGKDSVSNVGDLGPIPGLGKIPWRREWLSTPVFLPEEFHRKRSLVSYSPWVVKNYSSVLLLIWILCKTIHKMCSYVTEQQGTISLHSLLLVMPSNLKGKNCNLSSIFSLIWKVFLSKSERVSFHNIHKYLHWLHKKGNHIPAHSPVCRYEVSAGWFIILK